MHFKAQMTVLLDQPTRTDGPGETTLIVGYFIMIGVNAPDMSVAFRNACDAALRPKQMDGSHQSFNGTIIEAHVRRIEISEWEPFVRQNAKRIDEDGVYYSTGQMFFGPEDYKVV